MPESAPCKHIKAITTVKQPKERVCEDCIKIGARWVHLRTCQECGGTRCCDDSPNKHATKHAHATGHPVIAPSPVSVGCSVIPITTSPSTRRRACNRTGERRPFGYDSSPAASCAAMLRAPCGIGCSAVRRL